MEGDQVWVIEIRKIDREAKASTTLMCPSIVIAKTTRKKITSRQGIAPYFRLSIAISLVNDQVLDSSFADYKHLFCLPPILYP